MVIFQGEDRGPLQESGARGAGGKADDFYDGEWLSLQEGWQGLMRTQYPFCHHEGAGHGGLALAAFS